MHGCRLCFDTRVRDGATPGARPLCLASPVPMCVLFVPMRVVYARRWMCCACCMRSTDVGCIDPIRCSNVSALLTCATSWASASSASRTCKQTDGFCLPQTETFCTSIQRKATKVWLLVISAPGCWSSAQCQWGLRKLLTAGLAVADHVTYTHFRRHALQSRRYESRMNKHQDSCALRQPSQEGHGFDTAQWRVTLAGHLVRTRKATLTYKCNPPLLKYSL